MKAFWDQRYSQEGYAYGDTPNAYFKNTIRDLTPGKILLPAEGEGRNALYASSLGWDVYAFDISGQGKQKAESLARKHDVKIKYTIGDCGEISYPGNTFDAIGLIYAHFEALLISIYHRHLMEYLKPGGILIFEAYSKNHTAYQHINPKAGGPGHADMLYDINMIKLDFPDVDFIALKEEEIMQQEGKYHSGKGMVIRFFGKKKQAS
ncbi:MAG: class I SAM-dependent methyltransferase [Saprospiraceae bacterium]|nr:class I SAM-dependent methyltransferase [Saprospiraceae bacterium]